MRKTLLIMISSAMFWMVLDLIWNESGSLLPHEMLEWKKKPWLETMSLRKSFCILVISFLQWTKQRWCWRGFSWFWCWVSVSVGNYTMKLLSDQNDHSWFSRGSHQQESSRRPCATRIAWSWWKSWRPGWNRSRTAERNTWIWLRFRATQTERN